MSSKTRRGPCAAAPLHPGPRRLLVGGGYAAIVLAALCGCRAPATEAPSLRGDERGAVREVGAESSPDAGASALGSTNTAVPRVEGGGSDASSDGAVDTGSPADAGALRPPLLDETGAPLPQTDERPSTTEPLFGRRVAALFHAIAMDAPDDAREVFFPVEAYRLVKAIPNPAVDWERRLFAAFRRDVHAYHKKLGSHPERATLVRLELPESAVKWMKPGSEGNKLGYFRVLGSRLIWADEHGREQALELTSFISWRGAWYLVHLQGFR